MDSSNGSFTNGEEFIKSKPASNELKQEVESLRSELRKTTENFRNVRDRLEEAEDRNLVHEADKKSLLKKLAKLEAQCDKDSEQYQRDILEANDALESEKSKTKEYYNKTLRLEKEIGILGDERDSLYIDLEKANHNIQKCVENNQAIENEFKKFHINTESQISELKRLKNELTEENVALLMQIDALTVANLTYEKERTELTTKVKELEGLSTSINSEEDVCMKSWENVTLNTSKAFGKSIYTEIFESFHENESSMLSKSVVNSSTQFESQPSSPVKRTTKVTKVSVDAATQSDWEWETSLPHLLSVPTKVVVTNQASTQCEKDPLLEKLSRKEKLLNEMLKELKLTLLAFKRSKPSIHEEDQIGGAGDRYLPSANSEILSDNRERTEASNAVIEQENAGDEDLVKKINEELAEFREQLKRSQELFHSINTSNQSFNTTKSCPGLVQESSSNEIKKAHLVTISTQTDAPIRISPKLFNGNGYTSRAINEAENDLNGVSEYIYDEDDDESIERYRLRGPNDQGLSVIEETEHESIEQLSPSSSLGRTMSATKRARGKLVRMANTVDAEEPPPIPPHQNLADEADELKSELEYLSAASSLPGSKNTSVYNSLERPLQLSKQTNKWTNGNGNGQLGDDGDNVSLSTTTYGSPMISSPSSPSYWTPSQGSSQETLTNHDGDKTPINEDDFRSFSRNTASSSSGRTSELNSRNSNNSKKVQFSNNFWKPMLPIDNRVGSCSTGIIPDEDKDDMKRYAYDGVARSCDKQAEILSRTEWRTLRENLDHDDYAKFKKGYGQEDDTEEPSILKLGADGADLDELAEKYYERFPFLVGKLFNIFDEIDKNQGGSGDDCSSAEENPIIQKRFEELAIAFKTDHEKIDLRTELNVKEYANAKRRINEVSTCLNQTIMKVKQEKLPGEIREILNSLENYTAEFDLHIESLDRAAMRVGRLEVEKRIYKMIEVMVFYVRILKRVHGNVDEERERAKQLLKENGIPFPVKKGIGTETLSLNNNNHEKVPAKINLDSNIDKTEDWKSSHGVQRLLAPKTKVNYKKNSSSNLLFRESSPRRNRVTKFLSSKYEAAGRELYWPWTWDQSWSGIKRGFTLLLMILGIIAILRSVVPIDMNTLGYCSGDSSILSRIGKVSHEQGKPRF